MKVLMATDGSKDATVALRTASRLLRRTENQIVDLLCVAPELSLPNPNERKGKGNGTRVRGEYQRQIAVETERILKQGQQTLQAEGLTTNALSRSGSPSRIIVQLTGEYGLTVVGAHDRYERSKPGIGPVASRVVAHGSGAVLVGRELTAERTPRVLLGVDGSLASERAMELMASYFNLNSAEITLMHVVETPWVHLGLEREWFDYAGSLPERDDSEISFEQELRLGAEPLIEDARTRLERYGLSSTTVVEEGDPALEILSEAEKGEYDLIVLGATGAAGLKHDILGSVSAKVAHDATCSVLVVKSSE